MADPVAVVRRFNRSYTQRIGVLDDSFLGMGMPLGPARLLFEVGAVPVTGLVPTTQTLRERLGLDSGYLSRLLRRLERDGLIQVTSDPGDRRRRQVILTAAGHECWKELERRSDEADRYVGTFLKCVYLRDRVGQTFDGLITTVMEFGCFVQLLTLGVDGLLPLASLRDDNYQMARDGGQWIGERSKRRLAPGVRLRVIVAAVKPVEGMIDLELATD